MINHFIKTTDDETALKLKAEGFSLISKDGNVYTFMNDGKMNFADEDKKKMAFTNVLAM